MLKRLIALILMLAIPLIPGVAGPAAAADAPYVYRLGPGDKLQITTYGEDRLTGTFTVNSEGVVVFPLIGDVPARGLTLGEFRKQIVDALAARFIRNPSVAIEILNYRTVFVLGEIARAGEFPYSDGLTVYQVVARAGGFTFRANKRRVFIRHEGESGETAVPLTPATPVRPGDTIRIGARYF